MRDTLGLAIVAGLAAALAGAGAARADTPITTCGYNITAPGSYVLAADIGPCSGNGINVKVSNVNLMLNGYSITGLTTLMETASTFAPKAVAPAASARPGSAI